MYRFESLSLRQKRGSSTMNETSTQKQKNAAIILIDGVFLYTHASHTYMHKYNAHQAPRVRQRHLLSIKKQKKTGTIL